MASFWAARHLTGRALEVPQLEATTLQMSEIGSSLESIRSDINAVKGDLSKLNEALNNIQINYKDLSPNMYKYVLARIGTGLKKAGRVAVIFIGSLDCCLILLYTVLGSSIRLPVEIQATLTLIASIILSVVANYIYTKFIKR